MGIVVLTSLQSGQQTHDTTSTIDISKVPRNQVSPIEGTRLCFWRLRGDNNFLDYHFQFSSQLAIGDGSCGPGSFQFPHQEVRFIKEPQIELDMMHSKVTISSYLWYPSCL